VDIKCPRKRTPRPRLRTFAVRSYICWTDSQSTPVTMSGNSDVEKVPQHPTEKAFDGDSSDQHGHGEVRFIDDHGAESELQRRLSTRHITMIALGSSIGMGLWLGSGTSLASGGPAGIFLGYLLSGTMIWTVSQCIGEMAVL